MDTPDSYTTWLKENCGLLLNPARKAFPNQPRWIVLDEQGRPLGASNSMKEGEAVMDRYIADKLANFGRNDDADLEVV